MARRRRRHRPGDDEHRLQALEAAGALRVPYTEALAVAVYGALTEAGIVLSRAAPGSPSRDELLAAILGLVLTPA